MKFTDSSHFTGSENYEYHPNIGSHEPLLGKYHLVDTDNFRDTAFSALTTTEGICLDIMEPANPSGLRLRHLVCFTAPPPHRACTRFGIYEAIHPDE